MKQAIAISEIKEADYYDWKNTIAKQLKKFVDSLNTKDGYIEVSYEYKEVKNENER